MLLVLSAHMQLHKDGFISSWTNSFVGPWDPSQGFHNPGRDLKFSSYRLIICYYSCVFFYGGKGLHISVNLIASYQYADEKIKLWLFLPGRHSSVVETAQPAVSRLRGIIRA